MAHLLTPNCIHKIHNASAADEEVFNSQPVVQFLHIRPVETKGPAPPAAQPERYRLILSDGSHFTQAMLATQLNNLITGGVITKNSICRLTKFTVSAVKDKSLVVVLGLDVIQRDAEKVGNPENLNETGQAATTPATSAPPSTTVQAPPQQNFTTPIQRTPIQQQAPVQKRTTYPIESLSPYQNNWTIRARVTQKSEIKRWSNPRGEGHLFSVTLMDETATIKGTAFNAAADELYDKLHEGKVYYISKARVNLAKKKFSNIANDYELSLERHTEVEECRDASDVPTIQYNFVELGHLETIEKDSTADVVAIVKEVGDLTSITTKAGKNLPKRDLTLVDRSGVATKMTLWGKNAEDWSHYDSPVVAFKGVKVSDFGGRSLSMYSSSMMSLNPDTVESHALRGWYDAVGANSNFSSHSSAGGGGGGGPTSFNRSEFRSLNDVKESQLGMGDKADWFSSRATVMHIKADPISYPACPTCNKKVNQIGNDWRCEKCDRSYEAPEHRYLMSFAVADPSGQAWFSGFNEVGVQMFGMTANELQELKERDEAKFNVALYRANFQTYNFSCRARQDTFNDQVRVRYGVSKIAPLNYLEEANYLRDLLNTPWAQ